MSALDGILSGANDPACVLYGTDDPYFDLHDLQEATAELSALRAENARMREAVLRMIDCIRCDPTMDGSIRPMGLRSRALVVESIDFARAALGGRDD